MSRRSNRTEELAAALVLAQELVAAGYRNDTCLRWKHPTTGQRLTRRDLAFWGFRLSPHLPAAYYESERFFNHVAFAALDVTRS